MTRSRRPVVWTHIVRMVTVVISAQLVLALLLASAIALAATTVTPHFFGPTNTNCLQYGDGHWTCNYHNDTTSAYKDLAGQGAFYVWKWPSTSTTYYHGLFKFDGSFPTAWRPAARTAIQTWNGQPYYSPVMAETTGSTYDILFKFSSSSICSGGAWYACAAVATGSTSSKANAEAYQWWVITLNPAYCWGLAQSGCFDVQSLLTNELGHAWYLNHNPSWTSGEVQGDSCVWGSTTCYDSIGRLVSCSNCGNRRTVLAGDKMTLGHIYGALSPSPTKTPVPFGPEAASTGSDKPGGPPDTSGVPNEARVIAASVAIAN